MNGEPAASPLRPPEAIGIYGLTHQTLSLFELCRQNGVRVEFAVDQRVSGSAPPELLKEAARKAIPILPKAEFLRAADWGNLSVPVFAATIECERNADAGQDPYLNALVDLRKSCGSDFELWHPASLVAAFPFDPWPGRAANFGFRGSGNVLVQALVHKLLAGPHGRQPDPVGWMATFTERHFISVDNLLRTRLGERIPLANYMLIPDEYPTFFLTAAGQDGSFGSVLNVPTSVHFCSFTYWTHSTPSAEVLAEFKRLNVPRVAILRHPFATILAIASKLERPPSLILDDLDWLEHQAAALAEWLRRLSANRSDVHVVRYEDFVSRDPKVVKELAEALGVSIGDAGIEKLYDAVLFKDLLPDVAPGHFNRGERDKWRSYIGSRHREVFARCGFRALLQEFGYEGLDETGEPQARDEPPSDKPFPVQNSGAVPHRFFADPHWKRLPGPTPYMLRATTPSMAEALTALMASRELADLVEAGGLGPNPPPWSASIAWDSVIRARPM